MAKTVYFEPERQVPIFDEFDVIIVGGGPAGICAAIAAARNGSRTLVIESSGYLGGTFASGLPMARFNDGHKQIVWGIANEIAERIRSTGGLVGDLASDPWIRIDPESLKFVAAEMCVETGVECLLHTLAVDAIVDTCRIQGLVIENKGGRQAVRGNIVVDCSGDADIAYRAGVPCKIGRNSDNKTQAMTTLFSVGGVDWERFHTQCNEQKMAEIFDRLADANGFENPRRGGFSGMALIPGRPSEACFNATRVLGCLGTDPVGLTKAELAGRRQVWEFVHNFLIPHIPGFEKAYLASVASKIGIRETRRIVGEYVMSEKDICEYRQHDDAIGRGCYPIDIHNPDGSTTDYRKKDTIAGCSYALPYSVLVPKVIDNMLVAGRCASATHEALSAIRVIPSCMVMGQAAGTAASLCVKHRVIPRQLNIKTLQQRLTSEGVWLGEEFDKKEQG